MGTDFRYTDFRGNLNLKDTESIGIYGRHGADFVPASESFVPAAEQADNSV